jgi:Right handed beta helix region
MSKLLIILIIAISIDGGPGVKRHAKSVAGNYYFDPVNGNDANEGRSPATAFKSLNKIKALHLVPGDSILLKAGALFTQPLYLSCKGSGDRPIVVGKYGGKEKPRLEGDGSRMQMVHVFNSEYVVIHDLEVSNKGNRPVNGLNGVLVELFNYGTAKNITLQNLYVHDVYGGLVKDKNPGNAILLKNFTDENSDTILSRFDGLLVENCHIKNCQRNGLMMWGNWIRKKWYPSLHVVFRNNLLEGVPGDGIVPVGCERPLVEYNTMRDCPAALPPSEACDGIWPWSCDDALIQYNIVSDHKSQVDGYGFDSDWNCTNSVFQYNLSYNNDGGFLLVCNPGGWTPDWSIGNKGTIIRYNISINDGLRNYIVNGRKDYFSPVIHITGPVRNTRIEKNLFYIFKKPSPEIDKTILHFSSWDGYSDSTFFENNFLKLEEPNRMVELSESTNNIFKDNIFVGALNISGRGFKEYRGDAGKAIWFDKRDEHWKKLLAFLTGKTILINGQKQKLTDIISGNE